MLALKKNKCINNNKFSCVNSLTDRLVQILKKVNDESKVINIDLRKASSVDIFKSNLKTYLF